jgi:hypothetical protein
MKGCFTVVFSNISNWGGQEVSFELERKRIR